jgi:hypothetical protein
MNDLVLADKVVEWRRLKALVLDSVSSPITRRVYNVGLDEFVEWYCQEVRPCFTKATVAAWARSRSRRGLGAVSVNIRITGGAQVGIERAKDELPICASH